MYECSQHKSKRAGSRGKNYMIQNPNLSEDFRLKRKRKMEMESTTKKKKRRLDKRVRRTSFD